MLDEPFLLEAITSGLYWRVLDHMRQDGPQAWLYVVGCVRRDDRGPSRGADRGARAAAPWMAGARSSPRTRRAAFTVKKGSPAERRRWHRLRRQRGPVRSSTGTWASRPAPATSRPSPPTWTRRSSPKPPARRGPLRCCGASRYRPSPLTAPAVRCSPSWCAAITSQRPHDKELFQGAAARDGLCKNPNPALRSSTSTTGKRRCLAKAGVTATELLSGSLASPYAKGSLTLYLSATYEGNQLNGPPSSPRAARGDGRDHAAAERCPGRAPRLQTGCDTATGYPAARCARVWAYGYSVSLR